MAKKGLLLLNLGTPDAPTLSAIRRYLRTFLNDPRVIDLPKLLRFILVNGLIIPFRARSTLHAYQTIWTPKGSPLLHHTQTLRHALQAEVGPSVHVEIGMRYGNPSITAGLQTLINASCDHLTILPLYPQYASASTGSALTEVMRCLSQYQVIPAVSWIRDYYHHPTYIQALSNVMLDTLADYPQHIDYVLFSYHGIPERQLPQQNCQTGCDRKTACPLSTQHVTCYRAACYETTHRTAQALALPAHQYGTAFQSRLGKTPWIAPYTDQMLAQLAKNGIRNLAIVCPSFAVDCLETLEEIGIRTRATWKALGGSSFILIPCLNDHPAWISTILNIAML